MAEDLREIFVSNLRSLMERRGVSQADIVSALGVSTSTVSDWYNGRLMPRAGKIQRLADLLGVGINALMTSDGLRDVDDQDRLDALHNNPRLGMLFDRSARMSDEDVEFMIQMADRILKERDT